MVQTQRQQKAEKLAMQSLASSTQPNLRLPIEIVSYILEIHFEDHCRDRPGKAKRGRNSPSKIVNLVPYEILTTCKLFHRLATPHVYRHIRLPDFASYLSFVRKANIEAYRHVKKVSMDQVEIWSESGVKDETGAFKALEKRAAAYRSAVEKRTGVECESVWQTRVEFDVGRHECRLVKLFTAGVLSISSEAYGIASTFDPRPNDEDAFTLADVRFKETDYQPFLQPSLAPGDRVLHSLVTSVTCIAITEDSLPTYTRQGPAMHVRWWYGPTIQSVTSLCAVTRETVTILPKCGRHTFCCETEDERQSFIHPKLRLPCCDGPCTESKTPAERAFNAFMRSKEDPEKLKARLISEWQQEIA